MNIKGLHCRQDILIRPLLDVFLHFHVNCEKLAIVQKRVLYQMNDHSDGSEGFYSCLFAAK